MNAVTEPTMLQPADVAGAWTMLPAFLPLPGGAGGLSVNSFLLKGREPVLVDTGLRALGEPFMAALAGQIDAEDLRWIWISHADPDHVGNLARVLDWAPKARVLTGFLGMGKLMLSGLDVSRVEVIEPDAEVTLADRTLRPVRPLYYDAPETLGFYDSTDGVLFAADSFGAVLPGPAEDIADLDDATLNGGLAMWSAIDAPWLEVADRAVFERGLAAIDRLDPAALLSGHLPRAGKAAARLTDGLRSRWLRNRPDASAPLDIERALAA